MECNETGMFLLALIISLKLKAKIPGIPILPGGWPIIGHIFLFIGDNSKLYKTFKEISKASIQKGGSICVSLGLINYYYFTDPDDSFAIMNSSVEKHYSYGFSKPWLGEGIFTAEPHKWHINKKILYPMFQQNNLNKFLTVFNKQGRRLVKLFLEHVGKGAFDHEPHVLHIGLETICQILMGSKFNEGPKTARNQKFLDTNKAILDCVLIRFQRIWLHLEPIYAISSTKRDIDKYANIINAFSKDLLKQRKSYLKSDSKADENDTEDFTPFVDTLIRISQNNKEFNEKQVIDEINTIITSGYDTSSNTLLFALMVLGHHQNVQDEVYKELIEVCGDTDSDLDKYDITKLIYLEAFIKEVLRLFSIAPIISRRVNTDIKLKNCTIPAGTDCFISIYGIHRNPEWGDDVEVFNPDRWLNPKTMPKNPNLFAPFGLGKRYCVGKTYAMMSMKITLSHVVRKYRIHAELDKLVTQLVVVVKPVSGHGLSLELRN